MDCSCISNDNKGDFQIVSTFSNRLKYCKVITNLRTYYLSL